MANTPLYLNGIRAFEATARQGSFAAAAEELNIAPSAVSRMVALLEDRVGAALFRRAANKLIITPAGVTYQAGLTPLLDAMGALTAQVSARAPGHVLTVGVGPTFAVKWLIPRLASFQALAPEADVRITTGGAAAPFAEDWTCGVR
ncbi:MAG: LysR family transcriptional regulator, partial [Alphaproteobacteria bacterium]